MSLPDIHGFLDHREFLRAWFAAKKEANPRFSHRLFVRLAGQSSPSLLSDVIEGRRNLTTSTTEAFLKALKLSEPEAEYFRNLVLLELGDTPTERNRAWAHVSAAREVAQARTLDDDAFEYLSQWYVPAIRELAATEEFVADAEWLAARVYPRITAQQAQRALDLLFRLALLTTDEQGRVIPKDVAVATPRQITGLAAHNYYYGMLDRARAAIDAFRPAERHFTAVTVPVPKSLVPVLKRELDATVERLAGAIQAAEEPPDQVIQVNLNLFPLTREEGE